MNFNQALLILSLFLSLQACSGNSLQGGSEVGNPNYRDVTGEVSDTDVAQAFAFVRNAAAATDCPADQIIAVDAAAVATVEDIADDCSFALNLETGKSYSINFALEGNFVATMIFQATTTTESTNFVLSDGATAVDLGVVVISGVFASPEANPYEQNDQDDDGINDFDDSDDDEDGVDDDEDYVDCDGDGFLDDDECDSDEEEECEDDDFDCDGVRDENDNCQAVANEDQDDEDSDDVGDACDVD